MSISEIQFCFNFWVFFSVANINSLTYFEFLEKLEYVAKSEDEEDETDFDLVYGEASKSSDHKRSTSSGRKQMTNAGGKEKPPGMSLTIS